ADATDSGALLSVGSSSPSQRNASSSSRGILMSVLIRALTPANTGVDKTVDVAIEYLVGLRHFEARAQVLNKLLAIEEVGANLVAPAGRDVAGEFLLLHG